MSQVNKSVEQNAEAPVGAIPSSPTAAAAGMDEDHEVVQSKSRPPPSPDSEIVLGGGDPNGSNPGTDDDRSTVRPHSDDDSSDSASSASRANLDGTAIERTVRLAAQALRESQRAAATAEKITYEYCRANKDAHIKIQEHFDHFEVDRNATLQRRRALYSALGKKKNKKKLTWDDIGTQDLSNPVTQSKKKKKGKRNRSRKR